MLNARVDERQSTTAATIAPESPNRRRRCSCSGWAHAIGPRPRNRVPVVGDPLQLAVYSPGGAPGPIPPLYWAPLPWVEPVDHCALSGPVTVSTAFVTRSFHTVMTCVGATATTLSRFGSVAMTMECADAAGEVMRLAAASTLSAPRCAAIWTLRLLSFTVPRPFLALRMTGYFA